MKPKVLVLTGYGINCDRETEYAFNIAGADARRVHINDIIDGHESLSDHQILAGRVGDRFDSGGNALCLSGHALALQNAEEAVEVLRPGPQADSQRHKQRRSSAERIRSLASRGESPTESGCPGRRPERHKASLQPVCGLLSPCRSRRNDPNQCPPRGRPKAAERDVGHVENQ